MSQLTLSGIEDQPAPLRAIGWLNDHLVWMDEHPEAERLTEEQVRKLLGFIKGLPAAKEPVQLPLF